MSKVFKRVSKLIGDSFNLLRRFLIAKDKDTYSVNYKKAIERSRLMSKSKKYHKRKEKLHEAERI